MSDGVSSDMRILLQFKGGSLVRDLTTGTETLRTNLHAIPDIRTVTSELTQTLKNDGQLQLATRRAILSLIEPLLVPTLTTIELAMQDMGVLSAQQTIHAIHGRPVPSQSLLAHALIERESTAPVAG